MPDNITYDEKKDELLVVGLTSAKEFLKLKKEIKTNSAIKLSKNLPDDLEIWSGVVKLNNNLDINKIT